MAVEGLWCQTNLSVLDSRHVNIPVPRLRELPINNRAGSRFPVCFWVQCMHNLLPSTTSVYEGVNSLMRGTARKLK